MVRRKFMENLLT